MCRLIIAGSRTITDYSVVRNAIISTGLWEHHGREIEVVCGMARGVDLLGREFAKRNNLVCHEYPADWDKYGKAAGHVRNKQMAHNADALLAIWDGYSKGTKDMIKIAESLMLNVYVVIP